MAGTNKKREKKGLTDEQLAAKYDTGKPINLEEAIKKMAQPPSTIPKKQQR